MHINRQLAVRHKTTEQISIHSQYTQQKVKVSSIRFTLTYFKNKCFIFINASDLQSIKKQKLLLEELCLGTETEFSVVISMNTKTI